MKFKSVIFVMSFVYIFWFFIPNYLVELNNSMGLPIFTHKWLQMFGVILIAGSLLIIANMSYLFMKYGKGTPSITETTKKLVRRGIFKHTRNPMYISNSLIIIGIFCMFGSTILLGYAFLFFIAMHMFLIFVEEPHLKKKFGKKYEKFLDEVPRWI